MTTVYIENQGAPIHLPYSLVFWPNYRFPISPKRLFLKEIIEQYREPFFRVEENPKMADFFAIPFEYFFVKDLAPAYLEKVYARAACLGKKVLLFDYTDYVDRLPALPLHAVLFRVSAYRHHKRKNELIMPYFVEDLGTRYDIKPEEKKGPCVVGYCGQSQFQSRKMKWRAIAKRLFQFAGLAVTRDPFPAVHKRGVFWRAQALAFLRSGGTATAFIERPFYSLHRFSAVFDEQTVRREYVENLRNCDLALCVRGDANASQRFYEVLSASRIPLFLDTDCVLPLEEIIPYDNFMLRVSARDLNRFSEKVRSWEITQTPSLFLEKELAARLSYQNYLRLDRFFALVFDRERSPYRKLLFG